MNEKEQEQNAATKKLLAIIRGDRPTPESDPIKSEKERLPLFVDAETLPSLNHTGHNEDRILNLAEKGVFAVFDGMGGPGNGEKAAATASDFFAQKISELLDHNPNLTEDSLKELLLQAITQTHENLWEVKNQDFSLSKMGTTATAVKIWQQPNGQFQGVAVNVGDSRVYLRSADGKLTQITTDHAFAGKETQVILSQVDSQQKYDQLDKIQKYGFDNRSGIAQHIGMVNKDRYRFNPEIFVFPVKPGDQVILTSDGVHDNLTDQEIAQALNSQYAQPARDLAEAALARSAQGKEKNIRSKPDDISAIVVTVDAAASTLSKQPSADEQDIPITINPDGSYKDLNEPPFHFDQPAADELGEQGKNLLPKLDSRPDLETTEQSREGLKNFRDALISRRRAGRPADFAVSTPDDGPDWLETSQAEEPPFKDQEDYQAVIAQPQADAGDDPVIPIDQVHAVKAAPTVEPMMPAKDKELSEQTKKYLEQYGYIDISPKEIFDGLNDAEIAALRNGIRSGNKEMIINVFEDKVLRIAEQKSREDKLTKDQARQIAEQISKVLEDSVRTLAMAEANKFSLAKAGKLFTVPFLVNVAVTSATAAAIGLLGISTGGVGLAAGAFGLAAVSAVTRKFFRGFTEQEQKKKQAGKQAEFEKTVEEKRKEVLEEFFTPDFKAHLSALVANQLREQTAATAVGQIQNLGSRDLTKEEKKQFMSFGEQEQRLYESLIGIIKNKPEYEGLPAEQKQSMAIMAAQTLGLHRRNNARSQSVFERLNLAKPQAIKFIEKFNQARTGQLPEAAGYKGDLISVGLGTALGIALRTSTGARMVLGALSGAALGYQGAKLLDKKSEQKVFAEIEEMIDQTERQIEDLEIPSDQVLLFTNRANYAQSRLELGLLEANPLLKNRAQNFIYNVRQLEFKNRRSLAELIKQQQDNNSVIIKQQEADQASLKKNFGRRRLLMALGGAAIGAGLGYVASEARSWFGKDHAEQADPGGLSELDKILAKIPANADKNQPIPFHDSEKNNYLLNLTDSTVTSQAGGQVMPADQFFSTHKFDRSPFAPLIEESASADTTSTGAPGSEPNLPGSSVDHPAGSIEHTTVMVEGKPVILTEPLKAQLKTDDTVVDYGEVAKNKSVSEALDKAMAVDAKVTVINPDGKVLLAADGQPVKFDANLAHEGDKIFEVRHANGSKEIFVQKAGVTVKEGMSLAGRYEEISTKFKLDEIDQATKDKFNLDKNQGGFHERLNYQEAQAARNAWDAAHPPAAGQTVASETVVTATGNNHNVVEADNTPPVGPTIQADQLPLHTSKGEAFAGLDLTMPNGDELHYYDSADDSEKIPYLSLKTQVGTVFFQAPLPQNMTSNQAAELVAQAKLASTNLTAFSRHLGESVERAEAAKFYSVYDHADNVSSLADYKEGDYGQLDEFLKGLKNKDLSLLQIDHEYSPGLFALTSELLKIGWNQSDISEQLKYIDEQGKLNIALGLLEKVDKIQPDQLTRGLEMAARLALSNDRELAFAQLAADSNTDFGQDQAISYAQKILGANYEAVNLDYDRVTNQIKFAGLSYNNGPRHDVIFDIKGGKIIIAGVKEQSDITNDNLNRLSEHLQAEVPSDQGAGQDTGHQDIAPKPGSEIPTPKVVELADGRLSQFLYNSQGQTVGFVGAEVQHGGSGREYLNQDFYAKITANPNVHDQQFAKNEITGRNNYLMVQLETYLKIKHDPALAKEAEFLEADIKHTLDGSERKYGQGIFNRQVVGDVISGNRAPLKSGEIISHADQVNVAQKAIKERVESANSVADRLENKVLDKQGVEDVLFKYKGDSKEKAILTALLHDGNKEGYTLSDVARAEAITNKLNLAHHREWVFAWIAAHDPADYQAGNITVENAADKLFGSGFKAENLTYDPSANRFTFDNLANQPEHIRDVVFDVKNNRILVYDKTGQIFGEAAMTDQKIDSLTKNFNDDAALKQDFPTSPDHSALPDHGAVLPENYEISNSLEDEVGKPYFTGARSKGFNCMSLIQQAGLENKGEYRVLDSYNRFLTAHANKPDLNFSTFLKEQPLQFENASWDTVKERLEPGEYLINVESPSSELHGAEGHGAILTVTPDGEFIMYHASTASMMPEGGGNPVPMHELTVKIDGQSYQGSGIWKKLLTDYKGHIDGDRSDGKLYDKYLTDKLSFFDRQGRPFKPQLENDGSLRLGYVTRETDLDSYFKYNEDFAKNIDVLPLNKEPALASAA